MKKEFIRPEIEVVEIDIKQIVSTESHSGGSGR